MANKAIICGRLGHPPSTRFTNDGKPVCSFSVATDDKWTDKDGQKHKEIEWHQVVCFGRLAEICDQYLDKGKQVHIMGKLKTRKWDDKDGNKRQVTEIIANEMEMLSGKTEPDNAVKVERPDDTTDDSDIPF